MNNLVRYNGERVSFYIFSEKLVQIEELDFMGNFVSSQNTTLRLAWENKMYGRVIRFYENQIWWQRTFIRPFETAISNDGFIVVNDGLSQGGDGTLQGKFYIVLPNGEILFEEKFSANLGICGITENQHFAWCETYNSNISEDSSKFYVYLVKEQKKLFKVDIISHHIESVISSESSLTIFTKDCGKCIYDLSGNLLNQREVDIFVEKRLIESDSPWDLQRLIEIKIDKREISAMSENEFAYIYQLSVIASNKMKEYPNPNAQLERRIGEMLLARNRNKEAIQHFQKALALNPKVGIKKLLQNLVKD